MQEHIFFDSDTMTLHLLDQRLLPNTEQFFICKTSNDCIYALQNMVVRGAPAIGVSAAFGALLAACEITEERQWKDMLFQKLSLLKNARPTAVNLAWAVERFESLLKECGSLEETKTRFLKEARSMQEEDKAICYAIGEHGASLIKKGACIMTHCNAGALATAGYGTALGVIRSAFRRDPSISVISNETRPFLQGARLTCYELCEDSIPTTLACDNASALLMQKGLVDCVIVGADRIAKNGDTANKIGTFGLALLAHHFSIPFYVAAPLSTFDLSLSSGSEIPIEERTESEVRMIGQTKIVPDKARVFNYAFDVTPHAYISAIITEAGILCAPYEKSIAEAFEK